MSIRERIDALEEWFDSLECCVGRLEDRIKLLEAAVRMPRTEWQPEHPNSGAQREWQATQDRIERVADAARRNG